MDIKPIRTKADYRAALKEVETLMNAGPGTPEGERLDALATLVEAYERRHFPMDLPDPGRIADQAGRSSKGRLKRVRKIMSRITVTLDEDTAARARVQAAKRNMSRSRYIGELLRWELRRADEYEAAYRAWRASKPFPLKGPPQPYPKREELYDRPVFRRR